MINKNLTIPLNEEAISILDEIEKKYHLEESDDELIEIIDKDKPIRTVILTNLAIDLVLEKISNHEFLDGLQKNLGLSKDQTKSLALDVVNKLLPLLKPFTDEEIRRYRSTPEPNLPTENEKVKNPKELTTQELLIEKIKQSIPDEKLKEASDRQQETDNNQQAMVKKVEVKDVEENAEDLKKQREETTRPGTTGGHINKGQTDKYREPIE
ncbi:MAG: hypothetical protein AAB340_01570 [Patescibacteria group bacterium]